MTFATKVPQALFRMLTALSFHELATQLTRQVWVPLPCGSHALLFDYSLIARVQFGGEAYTEGVEQVKRGGVKRSVYGVSKPVAYCFKHRNKIGLNVSLNALKNARACNRESAYGVWRDAKGCRVANVIRPSLNCIG